MTQAKHPLPTLASGKQKIRIGECEIDLGARMFRRRGQAHELGSRAFDILAVIALAAGRLVSKNELMDAVWPDTFVEENNLHVHLCAIRKALGPDGKLIVTVPRRGYKLTIPQPETPNPDPMMLDRLVDGKADAMTGRASLLGREQVIADIRSRLPSMRVLTLVGAGGIGKTSIVREIARRLSDERASNIHFVELAARNTCRDVIQAVAAGCGVTVDSQESDLERFALMLTKVKGLLIIDNAEHVVEHVAQLIELACSRASELHVLVTSRTPLRVPCEFVYRVGPLALPEREDDVEAMLGSPSVRLFLRRLSSNGHHLDWDHDGLRAVQEICRRLDGVPLAIELAAGRAAVLGLERILHGLEEPLLYLGGGYRTAEERHKSVRASLDWSFDMLSDSEQTVFRRLCAIDGHFNADAACFVAQDHSLSRSTVMNCVCELVDKSLVEIYFESAEVKYRVLAPARAYGREKLVEAGELSRVVERHARYGSDKAINVLLPHSMRATSSSRTRTEATPRPAFSPIAA